MKPGILSPGLLNSPLGLPKGKYFLNINLYYQVFNISGLDNDRNIISHIIWDYNL
jgi:hypothetical protein